MAKLNLLLLLVLVVCALGLVTSQHKARKLFTELERAQARARELDVEYGKLQLEASTWGLHTRVEKVATGTLGMRTPDARTALPRILSGGCGKSRARIGKSAGSPDSVQARRKRFTSRSSSEWKAITASRPPGASRAMACGSISAISSSSRLTRIRRA